MNIYERNFHFVGAKDMERAKTDNVPPQAVHEEMNIDGNEVLNQDIERTLEECWKLVIRDNYSPMRKRSHYLQ